VSLESGEMCERYKEKVTLITTDRMGGNGVAYRLIKEYNAKNIWPNT